mmetsp:Transcript_22963/g.51964  ORF Transcript_22963/g.51964 Transcript_22963/m.51964 type:complete len:104 (+) Transcript_22963:692-1003(+)
MGSVLEIRSVCQRAESFRRRIRQILDVRRAAIVAGSILPCHRATCESALKSGHATERYRLMCTSLQGVLQPFAAQSDYSIDQLCDSVLAVFHDVTAVDVEQAR